MDSRAILDYALFQLTPTRTRCELVVFSGLVNEKIASGLFDPFVAHLKFAKDEISRGGYSVKLIPPTERAPWFTKATIERFVRFVSTPAVLERFVSIEREILQIGRSIQAHEVYTNATPDEAILPASNSIQRRSADSTKVREELVGSYGAEEENSQIRLQHLMETRKALLRKEQAMAYACSLVAGFEIDNLDDLIYFGDAFGASRLRDACINFKDICKKKRLDDLWVKELAVVESCFPSFSGTSGIVLANEIPAASNIKLSISKDGAAAGDLVPNGSTETSHLGLTTSPPSLSNNNDNKSPASDRIPSQSLNLQMPIQWPNHTLHYMSNLHGPVKELTSYQGYPFAHMQPIPPYLGRDMQWHSNMEKSSTSQYANGHKNLKLSARKKEKLSKTGYEDLEENELTESSDTDSGSDSDLDVQNEGKQSLNEKQTKKKHKKKSSRTVVIRNINYITSKGRDGNEAEVTHDSSGNNNEFVYEDSIKQEVEIAVGSLEELHKVDRYDSTESATWVKSIVNNSSDAASRNIDEQMTADVTKGKNTNEYWDVFQNLLKIDHEIGNAGTVLHPTDVQGEIGKVSNQMTVSADSFIVTEGCGGNEGFEKLDDFENEQSCASVMKRRYYLQEEILFPQRKGELQNDLGNTSSTCVSESSINKNRNAEDWFIAGHSVEMRNPDETISGEIFYGENITPSQADHTHTEKTSKEVLVDDSFMIQTNAAVDNAYDSQWKTDMSMVIDLTSAALQGNGTKNILHDEHKSSNTQEPNDLCVLLERDSGSLSVGTLWPMDHAIDISFSEPDNKCSGIDLNDNVEKKISINSETADKCSKRVSGTKTPRKETSKVLCGSSEKTKTELLYQRNKSSPASRPVVRKSKLEKEEEIRKKMEELLIQRQKRIAERTAASGLARETTKKDHLESKITKVSLRGDKGKTQPMNRVASVKVRTS